MGLLREFGFESCGVIQKQRNAVTPNRLPVAKGGAHQARNKTKHFVEAKLLCLLNFTVMQLDCYVVAAVELRLNIYAKWHLV
jgi:hypothetical protein